MNEAWLILGASSPIARAFVKKLAPKTQQFYLCGRDDEDLQLIANDLKVRFDSHSQILTGDISKAQHLRQILDIIINTKIKINLFIGHSCMLDNADLTTAGIEQMIDVNIKAPTHIIHAFVSQCTHPGSLIYLSSVAGCRGRYKNSLYGGSKKAIDTYIEGLKTKYKHIHFILLRLGFIDTLSTYGKKGVFYAQSPERCATFCMKQLSKRKTIRYYPGFWRLIMLIIKAIPEKVFNAVKV